MFQVFLKMDQPNQHIFAIYLPYYLPLKEDMAHRLHKLSHGQLTMLATTSNSYNMMQSSIQGLKNLLLYHEGDSTT